MEKKSPSTQVLIDTGVGRTVSKLRKCEEESVREAACTVYNKWKLVLERRVELSSNKIIVKSDLETERLRETSRKFIKGSLPVSCNQPEVAQRIEQEIFYSCKRLVNSRYRRVSRKVVFALKNSENKSKTFSSSLEIKQLVDQQN